MGQAVDSMAALKQTAVSWPGHFSRYLAHTWLPPAQGPVQRASTILGGFRTGCIALEILRVGAEQFVFPIDMFTTTLFRGA